YYTTARVLSDVANLLSDTTTTDQIAEGTSNLYYTNQRFDSRLATKTLDQITQGTSNKYIINNSYSNQMYITEALAQRLHVIEQTLLEGNTVIKGDVMPYSNQVYSLGSSTNRWKDIYLASGT
ncbi:MAG: hypothetical protein ACK56I_32455, partial [bacterium]